MPKITRTKVSDQVFDILIGYITEGKFKAGEKIPSENELCSMLGVSRPSVNAAVNRLRAMGLIEIRTGDGSYVKHFSTNDYIQNYADLVMDTQNLNEILEIRRALEFESAALAIHRAEPEDLEKLKAICDKMTAARKCRDYEALIDFDFEFHLQICYCSKNRYFPMMYELIRSLIRKQVEIFAASMNKRMEANPQMVDNHIQIYEALKAKDFSHCREILMEQTDFDSHM